MSAKPIRIGLLCRGTTLPKWQANAIRHLLEIPGAQLVVLGSPSKASPATSTGFRAFLNSRIKALSFKEATIPVDLSDPLASIPAVEFEHGSPTPLELKTLAGYGPDLILSFLQPFDPASQGSDIPPIWQFSFDQEVLTGQGVPKVRARFFKAERVAVHLHQLRSRQGLTAYFQIIDEFGGVSLDKMLMGASWLPAKLAVDLLNSVEKSVDYGLIKLDNKVDIQDNMASLISLIFNLMLGERRSATKQEVRRAGDWNIGILHQPISSLLDTDQSLNVRWLPSPSEGDQRTEPFGYIAHDGQMNVLYRKKYHSKHTDEIARLRPKPEGILKRSRIMLSSAASLTYPFVVQQPEATYAVISYPHQGRTELFRVAEKNDALDLIKTLIDKALINCTSIFFDGLWWMFGTDPDAPDNVLLAYHSQQLDGPYQPHALNPLKVDHNGSRPAGSLFMKDGVLWRPALDTSDPDTMSVVVLNRIDELTPQRFREVPMKRFAGFRGTTYGHGVRTLCAMGNITLVDGVRDPLAVAARSSKKIKKDDPRRKRHRIDSDDE